MKTDGMLTGKPLKSIIRFMIPIFIGNLFQQLYAMVDTIIVGQTLSSQALAGVGATSALSFLLVGFIQGMTAGYAVITSQRFGANDRKGIKQSVAISFVLSAAFTVLLTLISVFCAMPLLKLMQTPEDIIGFSYDYIIVIFSGLFATAVYNVSAAILRAVGDSRTPLVFLIIASVLNVGLDLLFIIVFKTGVAGAGIATVLSQGLSGIACIVYMFVKFPILRIKAFQGILKIYSEASCRRHTYGVSVFDNRGRDHDTAVRAQPSRKRAPLTSLVSPRVALLRRRNSKGINPFKLHLAANHSTGKTQSLEVLPRQSKEDKPQKASRRARASKKIIRSIENGKRSDLRPLQFTRTERAKH